MRPSSSDDLAVVARARGLPLEDVIDAIRPGVESLSARLRALAGSLTLGDAPPPERRDPGPDR